MAASPPRDAGNLRSLRPVRVLLAATDPRFLRAATFLLERDGFDVVAACAPADAVARARETRPHVVVLDGCESRAAAGRALLAIEAEQPPVRVVLVCEGDARPRNPFSRFEEYRSFPELTRELRRLYGGGAPGGA